jgi:hypothetical protein
MIAAVEVWKAATPPTEAKGLQDWLADAVFARRLAGTWVADATLNELGVSFSSLNTVHADGTLLVAEGYMFGGDFTPGFDSPALGAWKRTGPLEFTATELKYSTDENGSFENGEWVKSVVNAEVNEDFTEAHATVTAYLLFPDADPLNPAPEDIFFVLTGSAQLRRLPAE